MIPTGSYAPWFLYVSLVIAVSLCSCAGFGGSLPEIELYPTWSAVGLEIYYPPEVDVDDAASFEWRVDGGEWRPGVVRNAR